MDTIGPTSWTDLDRVFADPEQPVPGAEGCLLLPGLPDGALHTLLDLAGPQSQTPLLLVGLRHLGGALARPPATPDDLGARDAAYLLQTIGVLAGPHARDVLAAAAGVRSAMTPWSTGRTFINLRGAPADDADRSRAWTAVTYDRPRQLTARHDPAGLLHR